MRAGSRLGRQNTVHLGVGELAAVFAGRAGDLGVCLDLVVEGGERGADRRQLTGPRGIGGALKSAGGDYLKKAMPSSGMSSGRALAQRSTSSGVTTFFRWADM
ncbi:hypothetical protein GCM10010384_39120 [Streptomyces djakartensis]|uniref:Uncharacterized protein n=1 Tax=Streptomyces djakartensis TaxID=68193 RepID=A0ABQ3A053_9ACTN|nr:hypothetical protein GCM10010384_39120 [Streptomyces djakartensis]